MKTLDWKNCAAALVTAALLAGCGGSDKEVTFKSGGMTHTFAEGKDAVPKDFPIPLYPKAATTGSVSAESDKATEDTKFLMLSSTDALPDVGKFYQEQLKGSGWNIENVQTLPQLINISASKNQLDANVMLSSDGKKTTISLAVCKSSDAAEAQPVDAGNFTPDKVTPPTD